MFSYHQLFVLWVVSVVSHDECRVDLLFGCSALGLENVLFFSMSLRPLPKGVNGEIIIAVLLENNIVSHVEPVLVLLFVCFAFLDLAHHSVIDLLVLKPDLFVLLEDLVLEGVVLILDHSKVDLSLLLEAIVLVVAAAQGCDEATED